MALAAGPAWPAGPVAAPRQERAGLTRALVSAFTLFTLFAAGLTCFFNERVDGCVMHDRSPLDLGKMIAATTTPGRTRSSFGASSPWLYQYSHRRPAGRYVFSTYGDRLRPPGSGERLPYEKARIVPGSQEALLGDLGSRRRRPWSVQHAGSVVMARSRCARTRRRTPWLQVSRTYCFEVRVGALDAHRRRGRERTSPCPTPFPEPARDASWSGTGASAPSPAPHARSILAGRAAAAGDRGWGARLVPGGPTPGGSTPFACRGSRSRMRSRSATVFGCRR